MKKYFISFIVMMTLSACAVDKQKHFIVGAATSHVVYEYTGSRLAGCGAAVAIGLGKEYIIDINTHGQPDFADVVATSAGCTLLALEF